MEPELQQLSRPPSSSTTYTIDELVRLAEVGRLRVPEFQRSFVWDRDDVRKLFDSIWRGFPIGTLLLWKRKAPAGEISFGPVRLKVPSSTDALWVVDGQQRVTSLVGALSGLAADIDDKFELCFDLRRARFVHAGKKPTASWWIPLRVSLESRTLLTWLRENGQELSESELARADALGGALRDYRIPAYVVEHDDETLLREVFDRVNSSGKRISRAQVFHALFAGGEEPGSPASVVAELEHEGFGTIDEDRVVQSLLAIRGGDVQRDIHEEFESNESRADWYDFTEDALRRAIRFLRAQGVPHLALVPSALPLPVLAAFYHVHPDPDPWNEQLLARWLWRGWAHGYGKSGQTPALRQAIRAIHPRKGEIESAPPEYEAVSTLLAGVPDEPAREFPTDNFRTDSALGRLALLALVSLGPRSRDGAPIDVAASLGEFSIRAVTELVPDHRSELGARGFWPLGERSPEGTEADEVLASHAIHSSAALALQSQEFDLFVKRRGATISDLARGYLNSKIQSGAPVRPPIAELFVPDPR